jgi:hypothetical protein
VVWNVIASMVSALKESNTDEPFLGSALHSSSKYLVDLQVHCSIGEHMLHFFFNRKMMNFIYL